jgi:3-deoxy-D-manno-octulosonate 8-phosphate phosphatase (KDO 8-P phosphatase)
MGVLTGRASPITTHRMLELGVDMIEQCTAMGKLEAFEDLCRRAGVEAEQVAYIGDDLADLPVLVRCGYPMAVADAVAEVREVAKFVTTAAGGRGAVREAVEHLLKQMGRWGEVIEGYGM